MEEKGGSLHVTAQKIDSQRASAGRLWSSEPALGTTPGGGMERELGGRFGVGGHMCTYGRFMMLYGRGHHDIVASLSSS